MNHQINRRNLLVGAGALTVSILLPGVKAQAFVPSAGVSVRPPLDPRRLASYISVNSDGTVTAWLGQPDMGQGTDVGVAQMVAEELDLRVERVKVDFYDTTTCLNQGGASGSFGVSDHGKALANAAAEALLDPELLADPAIYPSDEVRERLRFLVDTGDVEIRYSDVFERSKR
jgi:CO/xanthine dehydrogenase Mo-binding subunit